MNLHRMLLPALLLSSGFGAAVAEEPPPADAGPTDAEVSPVGWKKTLGEARQVAGVRNGYALIFVTGADAASRRIESSVFWLPQVFERLQENYGCVKGTIEELSKDDQAKAKLQAAGVTQSPALILVDPDDGSLVDVTKREFTPLQMVRLLEDVDKGQTQKGMEAQASKESGNAELRLRVGQARLRKADWEAAGKDFEAALKSEDRKVVVQATIGLAAVALNAKDCKGADKLLAEAVAMMVEEKEAQDFESPMAEALQLQALSAWQQDLRDDATKYAGKLLDSWPHSASAQLLRCAGEDMSWDWYEGVEVVR